MGSPSGNLGRGLTDLIGGADALESKSFFKSSSHRFTPIFVDQVNALSTPPILSDELVASVRRYGLFCPIVVHKTGERFTLIAGGERLGAAREAGLREIPAWIVDVEDVTSDELAQAEADQHPAPNKKVQFREWMNSLALDIGCNVDELDHKLEALRLPAKQNQYRAILGSAISTAAVLILLWWAMGSFPPAKTAPPTIAVSEEALTPHDFEIQALANANDIGALTKEHEAFDTSLDPESSIGMDPPESMREPPMAIPPERVPPTLTKAGVSPARLPRLETTRIEGVLIKREKNGTRFTFDAPVFRFRDFIEPSAKDRLLKLGKQLANAPEKTLLVVTGHTDSDPVSPGGSYIDNYQIGMARAVAVTDFLVRDGGLRPGQVVATSTGENRPPFSNNFPSEKQKNRTVTLLLVDREDRE